jgi:hypothetical protein
MWCEPSSSKYPLALPHGSQTAWYRTNLAWYHAGGVTQTGVK